MPYISANLHAQDLIQLLKMAHARINRNKNDVCQIVSLSEETIVDWYNEITYAYAPFRAYFMTGKKVDEKTITAFLIFADSRTNSHAIKSSVEFLKEIITKYNAGRLRDLIGQLNIKLLEGFRKDLENFYTSVFDSKMIMVGPIPKQKGTIANAKKIGSWISDLDIIQDRIRSNAVEIIKQLECREEMFHKISNNLKM